MVEAYEATGGNVVAAMSVPESQISSYGVIEPRDQIIGRGLVQMQGMVEKPDASDAPSNLAVIGRYILNPSVMSNLSAMKVGAGGEIQLTDAIADDIRQGVPTFGCQFEGQRYDCGSKAGFLQATVAFALARDDLRHEFGDFLASTMAISKAAE